MDPNERPMETDPDQSGQNDSSGRLFDDESTGFDSALLLSLVSSLPDALVLVAVPERTIAAFNPAAERVFGYPPDEVLGRSTRLLHVDEESFRRFDRESQRVLAREHIYRGRFQMRSADGRIFDTEHTVCLVDEGKGEPRYAVSLVRDVTEQVEREETLREQRRMLRKLNRRLQEAQEEERRSLSRDLHDHMGQELTSLDLGLRALASQAEKERVGSEKAKEIVGECRRTVKRLEDLVRSIMVDLRPPMLDDLGLVPAARWYLGHRLKDAEIEPELVVPGPVGALRDEVQTAAFRVLQESLSNVIRHAGASRVEVRIEILGGDLHLQVADDGKGFALDESTGRQADSESLGLMGMAERAEFLGGDLAIDTEPGRGTRVMLRLPLSEETGAEP